LHELKILSDNISQVEGEMDYVRSFKEECQRELKKRI